MQDQLDWDPTEFEGGDKKHDSDSDSDNDNHDDEDENSDDEGTECGSCPPRRNKTGFIPSISSLDDVSCFHQYFRLKLTFLG